LRRRHAPFTSCDECHPGEDQRHESFFRGGRRPGAGDVPLEHSRGYSLVELVIVVAIIAIVAAIAIPSYREMVYNAQVVSAIADIKQISNDITLYLASNGAYPTSLRDVGRDGKMDPWGRPYEYLLIVGMKGKKGGVRKDKNLVPMNSDYDLYSCGRDGGTAPPITARMSRDDIVRANNGSFIGLASNH
jgi:general secretion pathway protein G